MSALNPVQNQTPVPETTFFGSCVQLVYDMVNKVKEVVMAILQTILPCFFSSASSIDPNAVTQLNANQANQTPLSPAQVVQQVAAPLIQPQPAVSTSVGTPPPVAPSGGAPAQAQPPAPQPPAVQPAAAPLVPQPPAVPPAAAPLVPQPPAVPPAAAPLVPQPPAVPPAAAPLAGNGQPVVEHADPLPFMNDGAAYGGPDVVEAAAAPAAAADVADQPADVHAAAAAGADGAAGANGQQEYDEWINAGDPDDEVVPPMLPPPAGSGDLTFADLEAAEGPAGLPAPSQFPWQASSSAVPVAAAGMLPLWDIGGRGRGLPPSSLAGAGNGFAFPPMSGQPAAAGPVSFSDMFNLYGASSSASADSSVPPPATSPFLWVNPGPDGSVPALLPDAAELAAGDDTYQQLVNAAAASAARTASMFPFGNPLDASLSPTVFPPRRDSLHVPSGGSLPHDEADNALNSSLAGHTGGASTSFSAASLSDSAAADSAGSMFDEVIAPASYSNGALPAAAASSASAASPSHGFPGSNPSNAADTPEVTNAALERAKELGQQLVEFRRGRIARSGVGARATPDGKEVSDSKAQEVSRTIAIEPEKARAGLFAACWAAGEWKLGRGIKTQHAADGDMDDLLYEATGQLERPPVDPLAGNKGVQYTSLGNARVGRAWAEALHTKAQLRKRAANKKQTAMRPVIVILTNKDRSSSHTLHIAKEETGFEYRLFSPNAPLAAGSQSDLVFQRFTTMAALKKAFSADDTIYEAYELTKFNPQTSEEPSAATAGAAAVAASPADVHVEAADD